MCPLEDSKHSTFITTALFIVQQRAFSLLKLIKKAKANIKKKIVWDKIMWFNFLCFSKLPNEAQDWRRNSEDNL